MTSDVTDAMAEELSDFQLAIELLFRMQEKRIRQIKEELARIPKGSLTIKKADGKYYYDKVLGGERTPISDNMNLVYDLARRKYLELKLKEHEHQYFEKKGRHVVSINPSTVSRRLKALLLKYRNAKLDILRITLSPLQYQWVHANYPRDTIPEGEKVYYTYSGIPMRSNSERDIGNEMELEGVPYRYAMKMVIDVSWMAGVYGYDYDGNKAYYPDFVILTFTGELIIWEHLGRLDLPNYRSRNAEKFAGFRQGHYAQEHNYILTVEKDLEDGNFIRRLIARRIRPYI